MKKPLPDLGDFSGLFDAAVARYPETIIYGFCDLETLVPDRLSHLPRGVSLAIRMDEALMDSVHAGPTGPYYAEYIRVNALINELTAVMVQTLTIAGYRAKAVHSSERVDVINIAGEFPHKTAAVQAGLGWIGRNCQLVTRAFGPRVRLGTVLTDASLAMPPAPTQRSYCGDCDACVRVCPTGALTGAKWTRGMERERILDAAKCDAWKKTNYGAFDGNVCGICTSACPMGAMRRKEKRTRP